MPYDFYLNPSKKIQETITCDPGYEGGGTVHCDTETYTSSFDGSSCTPTDSLNCTLSNYANSDHSNQTININNGTYGYVICDAGFFGGGPIQCVNGELNGHPCLAKTYDKAFADDPLFLTTLTYLKLSLRNPLQMTLSSKYQ